MNPDLPERKPNRLFGYDYSQNGEYFVTRCTLEKNIHCQKYAGTAMRAVPALSEIVGVYKSKVFVEWLNFCKCQGISTDMIWQRSFHDHIIRCQRDYDEIWQYIDENPLRWELDCYY